MFPLQNQPSVNVTLMLGFFCKHLSGKMTKQLTRALVKFSASDELYNPQESLTISRLHLQSKYLNLGTTLWSAERGVPWTCKGCAQQSLVGPVQDLRTGQLCLDHDHNTESLLRSTISWVDLILPCKWKASSLNNDISLCPASSARFWELSSSLQILPCKANPSQTAFQLALSWACSPLL